VKRTFKLKLSSKDGDEEIAEEKTIIQLQTTCWEDDNAITDSSQFEDLDKIIKYIKKHRQVPSLEAGHAP
jgi:hypothetical protein